MKVDVRTIAQQAVWGAKEVDIGLPKEECDAIRKALSIVGKYRKLALQCASHKDKNSDWTMVDFAVKNDRVIITVKYGMCG